MTMPSETLVPMHLQEPHTLSPQKHRISPAKNSSPKRIFEMATREGTNVWKARRVSREADLQSGEVYITHRRILDETDCYKELAKLRDLKGVLVSEGLILLSEDMDMYFDRLSKVAMHRSDVEIIMTSMKSYERNGSFNRFAHALYNGCKKEGEVYNAIVRSGINIFWDVIGAAAEDNPSNESLSSMKNAEGMAEFHTLKAWSKVYVFLEERHKRSHPFNFIHGDVQLTEAALNIFKFIATESKDEKYKEMLQVMHVAIPFIAKRIAQKKMEVLEGKAREKMEDEVVCNKLPRRNKLPSCKLP